MGRSNIDGVLSTRRLNVLVNMLQYPEDNEQLRTAVFGSLIQEVMEDTDAGWSPWVELLFDDLQIVNDHFFYGGGETGGWKMNVRERVEQEGIQILLDNERMGWIIDVSF